MEADDRRAAALVEVVEPQPVDLGIVRLEVVARQAVEALVGCAEDVHEGAQAYPSLFFAGDGAVTVNASAGRSSALQTAPRLAQRIMIGPHLMTISPRRLRRQAAR